MARLLTATGEVTAARAADLDVPDGIADVLRLRLLQLGEPARETLAVASVAGREFDVDVAEAALGRGVLDDLDEALDVGLVMTGEAPGTSASCTR